MQLTFNDTTKEYEKKEWELCPSGTHAAILYAVIDYGTQQTNFGPKRQLHFMWEIPLEKMKDGQPFGIFQTYTASIGDKATLTAHLTSWLGARPTKIDPSSLLDRACMISVIHNKSVGNDGKERIYANIAGITSLPKGMTIPKRTNELMNFDLDNFDQAVFDKLPKFIQNKIELSPEYQKLSNPVPTATSLNDYGVKLTDDEIPF